MLSACAGQGGGTTPNVSSIPTTGDISSTPSYAIQAHSDSSKPNSAQQAGCANFNAQFARVDCYIPSYTASFAQQWTVAYADFDDLGLSLDHGGADSSCGNVSFTYQVSGGNPQSVKVTNIPATISCPKVAPTPAPGPATILTSATINADPKAGPQQVTLTWTASNTQTDPSDTVPHSGPQPVSALFTMVMHIGQCLVPGSTPSAIRSHVVVHSDSSKRPLGIVGGSPDDLLITPIAGNPPPVCVPPPPAVAKSLITVTQMSAPYLDLTDSADATFGALTWAATETTGTLKNITFSNPTTPAAPHSNRVSFQVPVGTKAGDYTLQISVKTATGQQSAPSGATIHVLPPNGYSTSVDTDSMYEVDSQGNPVLGDANLVGKTSNADIVPDFGATSLSGTMLAVRQTTHPLAVVRGPYDPHKPTPGVLKQLDTFLN